MPYFYFDLVIGRECLDQGGMILENLEAAVDRADRLAWELSIIRPELKSKSCAVRVTDDDDKEIYRRSISSPIGSAEQRLLIPLTHETVFLFSR